MTYRYDIKTPETVSDNMSAEYLGCSISVIFFDSGIPVLPVGTPIFEVSLFEPYALGWITVPQFSNNEWRTNGHIKNVRVNLDGVTGYTSYIVQVFRTVEPMPMIPVGVFTSPLDDIGRLRTDNGHTGFYEGRQFRYFKEWSTATTGTFVFKFDTPVNAKILEASLQIDLGEARLENVTGGTEGGTFTPVIVYPVNAMTNRPQPYYTPQVTLSTGGTYTGGNVSDVLRSKTSDNTNHSATVGSTEGTERGGPPGVYYYRLTLTGAVGVFRLRWEENP